ncbi:MAG: sensor histidine kinase, partial [Jiangellaceae bacterium]
VLARLVARPDAGRVVTALERVPTGDPPASAAEREDRTEAVEAVLRRVGVSAPWDRAGELVAAGVAAGDLAAVLADAGDGADIAVAWLGVRAALAAAAEQISASVGRISELTGALRGYTYVDRAPQQEVDVHAGLEATLSILGHKLPPGVEVVRDYANDLGTIHAYGGQLNQVWTNLIDNAIDAVGDDGRITVRTRADGDGVVVEVADNGCGIPADLHGHVFDPFVTSKPPGQGTGLGLNITHQIVTGVHAGRISVHSEPGSTVFRVRLPSRPPGTASDDD